MKTSILRREGLFKFGKDRTEHAPLVFSGENLKALRIILFFAVFAPISNVENIFSIV